MGTDGYLLVAGALAPAIVLMIYIYKKDKSEKEPVRLLLLLFVLGAVSCYPAAGAERLVGEIIYDIFVGIRQATGADVTVLNYIYKAVDNVIGIALVEEGAKLLVLYLITGKNKNFNSLFDGLIYSVFVSLGFAALENVNYALSYGWKTVAIRAIVSVPGHMFFGVIMGYGYTMWHMAKKAQTVERVMRDGGYIVGGASRISTGAYFAKGFIFAVLAHGFFDFCLSFDTTAATVVFYAFVAVMYFFCFRSISKLSKNDTSDFGAAFSLVLQKYPDAAIPPEWM